MGCHKDKKSLPALEGTRKAMIEEGALDASNPLLIANKEKFEELNSHYSAAATRKTNIKETLFTVEDKSKLRDISKNADGSTYRGQTITREFAVPNITLFDAIDATKPTLLQKEEMPASKANAETIANNKKAIGEMGVNLVGMDDYAKGNPEVQTTGVNGLADLTKGIIAIAQGKEDVALIEEMVHIATAILEQVDPKLVTELISKIGRFKIYKKVLETYGKLAAYQLSNGKPDIRKIKKEAADKLISELIIFKSEGSTEFPELMEEETVSWVKDIWRKILDKIAGIYKKTNINIFEIAADRITKGNIGNVSDIKSGGVYSQIETPSQESMDLVEKGFNLISSFDAKMELKDEVLPENGVEGNRRHYTYVNPKGELVEVAKSVTEKIDAELEKTTDFKKKPRTGINAVRDENKRVFGSEGHRYIQEYILNNLIDAKTGLARSEFGTDILSSTLDESITSKLAAFAEELISSYPEGTRFMSEVKVINEKEEGYLASAIDFLAIQPITNSKNNPDVKIDILDWKFLTIDKDIDKDIPFYKQGKWKKQMGQYSIMLRNYGFKNEQFRKMRMLPFLLEYSDIFPGEPLMGQAPYLLEIGALNSLKETNPYLLPVPIQTELTGNLKVDKLVTSLNVHYDNMANKDFTNKKEKALEMNQLAIAIRQLQVSRSFEPLASVVEAFITPAENTLKGYKNLDYTKLSLEELNKILNDFLEFKASAKRFTELGSIFTSEYRLNGIGLESEKVLLKLEKLSDRCEELIPLIENLQGEYAMQVALDAGYVSEENKENIINPEKPIAEMNRLALEGSKLSNTNIKIISDISKNMESKGIILAKQLKAEHKKLSKIVFDQARAMGKTVFELIAREDKENNVLSLIKHLDEEYMQSILTAFTERDIEHIKKNINIEEYTAKATILIDKQISEINDVVFDSVNEDKNEQEKDFYIEKIKNSLDVTRVGFNGFNNKQHKNLVMSTLIEEGHESTDYLELSKNPDALALWKFRVGLNNRSESVGYLGQNGDAFWPLMEATAIQRLRQSDSSLSELKDLSKDLYTSTIEEGKHLTKMDPETGKVRLKIPTYYTRTNRAVAQLSKDEMKTAHAHIDALIEYELRQNAAPAIMTMLDIIETKGEIATDPATGALLTEGSTFKKSVTPNTALAAANAIIDDVLFGISEQKGAMNSIATKMSSSKSEEDIIRKELSLQKLNKTMEDWIHMLGVGWNLGVTIANTVGNSLLAYIRSGGVYNTKDFFKALRQVTSINQSPINKALIHHLSLLNEDESTQGRRDAAWDMSVSEYVKTYTFKDAMMVSNFAPEKILQLANATAFLENSMVRGNKIVNISEYIRNQDRNLLTEQNLTPSEVVSKRNELRKSFDSRVKALRDKESLTKITQVNGDEVIIPGIDLDEKAIFSSRVKAFSRKLNGQTSQADKAGFKRYSILRSFMMFKTWIPKFIHGRLQGVEYDLSEGWEYGRMKAWWDAWSHVGLKNIGQMKHLILGTEKGLKYMDEILENKKRIHFLQTGQELTITPEEFHDLMQEELNNMMKELGLMFTMLTLLVGGYAAKPPEDASLYEKNRYNYTFKLLSKTTDEILFFYTPSLFSSISRTNIIPALGLLTSATKVITSTGEQVYGFAIDDKKLMNKAHPLKYTLNMIPGPAQLQSFLIPQFAPEFAKDMGLKVSPQSRMQY